MMTYNTLPAYAEEEFVEWFTTSGVTFSRPANMSYLVWNNIADSLEVPLINLSKIDDKTVMLTYEYGYKFGYDINSFYPAGTMYFPIKSPSDASIRDAKIHYKSGASRDFNIKITISEEAYYQFFDTTPPTIAEPIIDKTTGTVFFKVTDDNVGVRGMTINGTEY